MPTDKLFTGQRLDSTGLYFYNARYYDPMIGRFISPDTIIPHPANPQSFNRYSYCLNNPLKYIDPSGRYLDIEGIGDISTTPTWMFGMFMSAASTQTQENAATMVKAWNTLSQVAPILAETLVGSNITTHIQIDPKLESGTRGTNLDHKIHLNKSLLGDYEDMASTMGHESFHEICDQNNLNYSLYEEACAYSIGRKINKALGNHRLTDFMNPYDDLTPSKDYIWVDKYLTHADWFFGGWGDYDTMNVYQSTTDYQGNVLIERVTVPTPHYPDVSVGGYKRINALYIKYY